MWIWIEKAVIGLFIGQLIVVSIGYYLREFHNIATKEDTP